MSLHIDLAHPQRTTPQWSTGGLLSTGRFGLAVGILAALYVIGFVRLGTSLRLDFDAGYWLGGGTLFVVIGLVGLSPLVHERKGFAPLARYLLLVGVFMAGYGAYRQHAIEVARAECRGLLEGATDVHARIKVFNRQVHGLPSLSSRDERRITCRTLLE